MNQLSQLSRDRLVSLLYILGRDHLPLGKIEDILRNNIPNVTPIFSNKPLEQYANAVLDRLLSDEVDISMRKTNTDRIIEGNL